MKLKGNSYILMKIYTSATNLYISLDISEKNKIVI